MDINILKSKAAEKDQKPNYLFDFFISESEKISVYSKSVFLKENSYFFLALDNNNVKHLYQIKEKNNLNHDTQLSAEYSYYGDLVLLKSQLTTLNRISLQKQFPFLKPVILGRVNSFGFGDRLGLANAGHIRSLSGSDFKPILAQQSIRELTRTKRTPEEVMDAAVWAVFQEGYTSGFGADADHLKTKEDIDLMLKSGFTMFTFDPGEHVNNNADNYSEKELQEFSDSFEWGKINDSIEDAKKRYLEAGIKVSSELSININEKELLTAYAKYGNSLIHIYDLYKHISTNAAPENFEIEISVDETDSVTSPFEHFFIANELNRLSIRFISLAPRFIGEFEKGIDYKGDLDLFEREYKKHLDIVNYFGNYKISLHSGSDKFSVYRTIGKYHNAVTHVKTAGTSYLEALKTISVTQPDLFKEILDYSAGLYDNEKRTYHVSADLNRVKKASDYRDEELPELFNSDDVRQVLHVTFGRVLTDKSVEGEYLFKTKILDCLKENEEIHYNILIKHFIKHLDPFK